MISLGLSLGLGVNTSGGASPAPPSYERTAFVDTAGNGGSVLNNPAQPFSSFYDAAIALLDAYPSQSTTIRLMSNANGGDTTATTMDILMGSGLTIMSHDATVRTLTGTTSFGYNPGLTLNLSKVTIAELRKEPHASTDAASAGTITGDANTTITLLILESHADPGNQGAMGSDGGNVSGSGGQVGADGNPPEAGGTGESIDASGGHGQDGGLGFAAWSVTLLGTGLLVSGRAVSLSVGGQGGVGGFGGTATPGNGGAGGSSTAIVLQDGGDGGNGGASAANGGNGGSGGVGGRGGNIDTYSGTWTVTMGETDGAAGGAGGYGGSGGLTNIGIGGNGGNPSTGGAPGATGAQGSYEALQGADGVAGADGQDGIVG